MRVSMKDFRAAMAELLSRVGYGREQVTITRHGKPVAVLVSLEDASDLARLRAERVSPEFKAVAERVMDQNEKLYTRLAGQ